MRKIAFAMPSYGPVDPDAQKSIRQAIMFAALDEVDWVGDVSHDKERIDRSRTHSLREAQYMNVDGVLWCDSDMVVERHTFHNLITSGHDLVAALAFDRKSPYAPCAFYEDPFRVIDTFDCGDLAVDGVGFGCVYTSMKILNAVNTFAHPMEIDEDRFFCMQAKKLGFQPYVDTITRVGHQSKPSVIDIRDSLMASGQYAPSPTLPAEVNP